MAPRVSTSLTAPVSIAACGIPYITAVSGDSASVSPPPRWMARIPSRPSFPMPVSTSPQALGPHAAATDANRRSMDGVYREEFPSPGMTRMRRVPSSSRTTSM